ncbi:MAG: hypothetical protein ACJA1P_001990 [Maribacter sp.]|jgi:hypothetical protein
MILMGLKGWETDLNKNTPSKKGVFLFKYYFKDPNTLLKLRV